MCRANRACGPMPRPVPTNGCGMPVPPMPMNGCNPMPLQQQMAPGRVVNCGETVQTVIEPTVTCAPTVYNHFNRVEHIVPVQKTDIHVFHNQHDTIIQEQHIIDNVTERHMGPTQTFSSTVQGPSVDMGWVNSYNQTPLTPLQAANMSPVVNNNLGFNQLGINQQVPLVNNNFGMLPNGGFGLPGNFMR